MVQIDYYYFSISPFAYLGHQEILRVAEKHSAQLNFKPVDLFKIWEVSGAVPPAKRPPVRQRMRFIELQRVAEYRNLPINIRPEYFPTDPQLADKTVIALIKDGHNPADYMGKVFAAVWAENKNIADQDVVAELLRSSGFDAQDIISKAQHDEMDTIRQQNSQDAIKADAVGVPTYVLNGEAFWGQDRIEHLDAALTSGRTPFSAD
ncbi:2-hydroxychromene-2-carboxylate isomerase [Lentilitoribacter sp. EG35]|uniref:2-hydroxychromene-2-carboxylate isomerase n=1 Tax=Lentilitoribacter sp. EG35 TaxID=3234192 RepID=UPI00345FCDE6